jgi:hypothetical protein
MSDEITTGGNDETAKSGRHFVPVQIGEATVFVERSSAPIRLDSGDDIHPVAPPTPQEALERAGNVLQEFIAVFDARIKALTRRPEEVSVEFSLGFEVKGKATLIPVLLSGETSTHAAIKVTAKWNTAMPPQ